MLVVPSPKVHAYEAMVPSGSVDEVPLNDAASPLVLLVNAAVGHRVGRRGHGLGHRVGVTVVVGHGEPDLIAARAGVAVVRGRGGAGLPVAEVPGVRGDRAVTVGGGRPVERHVQVVGREGEVRGRRIVGHLALAAGEVVLHLRPGQHPGVDRDVVDGSGEVRAGRHARPRPAYGVAADPPVAHVALAGGDVGPAPGADAVDVEGHARGTQRGDHVVPPVVVVGRGRGDRLHAARVDPEDQPTGVVHVDVAVVAAAVGGGLVAEADDLAAPGGGGLEPRLGGEHLGGVLDRSRRHPTGGRSVEGRRRVGVTDDGTGGTAGHPGAHRGVVEPGPVGDRGP